MQPERSASGAFGRFVIAQGVLCVLVIVSIEWFSQGSLPYHVCRIVGIVAAGWGLKNLAYFVRMSWGRLFFEIGVVLGCLAALGLVAYWTITGDFGQIRFLLVLGVLTAIGGGLWERHARRDANPA